MGVSKGYKKPTSKRRLREEYQKELAALPVGDPKRLTILRLIGKLEGHSTTLKATDYPERHKKKPAEPVPPPSVDDGGEPVSEEVQRRTEEYERLGRAWNAYFNNQQLPDDSPDVVREVAGMKRRNS